MKVFNFVAVTLTVFSSFSSLAQTVGDGRTRSILVEEQEYLLERRRDNPPEKPRVLNGRESMYDGLPYEQQRVRLHELNGKSTQSLEVTGSPATAAAPQPNTPSSSKLYPKNYAPAISSLPEQQKLNELKRLEAAEIRIKKEREQYEFEKNGLKSGSKEVILAEVQKRHIKFKESMASLAKHYGGGQYDFRSLSSASDGVFNSSKDDARRLLEALEHAPKDTVEKLGISKAEINHILSTDFNEVRELMDAKQDAMRAQGMIEGNPNSPEHTKYLNEKVKKLKSVLSKVGGGRRGLMIAIGGLGSLAAFSAGAETLDNNQEKDLQTASKGFQSKSWSREPSQNKPVATGAK